MRAAVYPSKSLSSPILDRAGNRNPDGLDFLAAPERLAEASFEPVVSFDGVEVRLGASPVSPLTGGWEIEAGVS